MEISNFSDVLDCYPNIKSTETISDDAKRMLSVLMYWYRKENCCCTSIMSFPQLAIVCRLSVFDMDEAIKLLRNLDFVKFSMLTEGCYSYEILCDNIKHYNDEITKYSEKEEIGILPTPEWNSRVCKTAERIVKNYREHHNLTDK